MWKVFCFNKPYLFTKLDCLPVDVVAQISVFYLLEINDANCEIKFMFFRLWFWFWSLHQSKGQSWGFGHWRCPTWFLGTFMTVSSKMVMTTIWNTTNKILTFLDHLWSSHCECPALLILLIYFARKFSETKMFWFWRFFITYGVAILFVGTLASA